MAETSNAESGRDDWSDGVSKLMEATRHNMTAANLATAGFVALGAATVAYMWDPQRRTGVFDATRRWTDDMTSFWRQSGSGSTSAKP